METGGDVRSLQNRCLSILTHSCFCVILKHFGLSLHIYNCAKNGYNWLWKSIPTSHAVCTFLQIRCQYFCVSLHVGWNSSCIQTCFWFHWKPTCLLSVVLLTNSSDSFHTKWDLWSICAIGIHTRFIRWNRVCFIKKRKKNWELRPQHWSYDLCFPWCFVKCNQKWLDFLFLYPIGR